MKKYAHISFDDVIFSLRWISHNHPKSVFDTRFFGALRNWHKQYGACFSLYVFEKHEDFCLTDIPLRYYSEFHENASWLKFGFHGKCHNQRHLDFDEFIMSYTNTTNAITAFAGENALCGCLRLHRWFAHPEQIYWLRGNDVTAFLCSDNNTPSYDLSDNEYDILSIHDKIEKNGIEYIKTHVRYETSLDIVLDVRNLSDKAVAALFTHELYFDSVCSKIEKSIKLLTAADFEIRAF